MLLYRDMINGMLMFMELLKSIILGCVQGVTEFLPVSSSGHLLLLKHLFGMEEVPKLFDVMLHLATLIVVCVVFWKNILSILRSWYALLRGEVDETDSRYLAMTKVLIIGTLCTAVLGYLLKDIQAFQSPDAVSILFICTAVLLISTRYVRPSQKDFLNTKTGLVVGIAQGLGTLPGISRSGITITAALWSGVDRQTAGEISFLLSIPAICGALILEGGSSGSLAMELSPLDVAAGCTAALITGFFSLKLLLWLIRSGRLYYFSLYLLPLGIAGLILL